MKKKVVPTVESDFDAMAERLKHFGYEACPICGMSPKKVAELIAYLLSKEESKLREIDHKAIRDVAKGLSKWQRCQECGMPATYGDGKTWARCNPHQYEYEEKIKTKTVNGLALTDERKAKQ